MFRLLYICFPLIWNFIRTDHDDLLLDDNLGSEPLPGHLVDELVAADPGPGPVQAGAPVQLETPSDNNQMRNEKLISILRWSDMMRLDLINVL